MNALKSIRDRGDIPASLVELQAHFGGIPLDRIGIQPPPGTATEKDLWRWKGCELVDGTIIVRTNGPYKGVLKTKLLAAMMMWNSEERHGQVLMGCGHRFTPELIRAPDLVFITNATWNEKVRDEDDLVTFGPDLAIDFMTRDNTQQEMQRKRDEYFAFGTKVVWNVDTVEKGVWETIPASQGMTSRWIGSDGMLRHDELLPGFEHSLGDWFAEVDGGRPGRRK